MIAGLEEITGGEIWIGDKLVNDLPPKIEELQWYSKTMLCILI